MRFDRLDRKPSRCIAISLMCIAVALAACTDNARDATSAPIATRESWPTDVLTDDGSGAHSASTPAATGGTPPAEAAPAKPDAALVDDARLYSLEVYAGLPPEAGRVVWDATQTALSRCLADRGFDHPPTPYAQPSRNSPAADGYPPTDALAQGGYLWHDIAFPIVDQPGFSPDEIDDPALAEAYQTCNGVARASLDQSRYLAVQQQFATAAGDIAVAVSVHPDMQATKVSWQDCMRASGYEVTDDARSAEDLALQLGNDDFHDPAAVAVALADVTCQRQARLVEVGRDISAVLVAEWLEQNPGAITELNAAIDDVVQRAEKVLNG